jgi:DNA topoisomerase VI subunit B
LVLLVRLSDAFWIFAGVSAAESPAEFFAENKNIAGFDNVSC